MDPATQSRHDDRSLPHAPRPLDCLSLVVPIYNEEAVLPLLVPRVLKLLEKLPCRAEVVFVNDGSRDNSSALLHRAAAQHSEFKIVEFSRNFGHQPAITAGMDFAVGDAVVILDADLQDPPELVLEMVQKYRDGFDVVYAQRTARRGETWFKRVTAYGFYRLMRTLVHRDLPVDAGDFRLMSRPVVDALGQMREQHRFVRGMVTWLGFRQTAVPFERAERAAGETKYPLHKMLAFAWRAISSFSGAPLRLGLLVGFGMLAASGATAVVAAWQTLSGGVLAGLTAWLVSLQVGLSGVVLVVLGVMGDYLARIYDELKGRPIYVVQATENVSPQSIAGPLLHGAAAAKVAPGAPPSPHFTGARSPHARSA